MQPHEPKIAAAERPAQATGLSYETPGDAPQVAESSNGKQAVAELEHARHGHVPVHAAPRTGRKLLIIVIALAIALAAAFFFRHHQKATLQDALESDTALAADAPAGVDVVRVSFAPATHVLTLPGEAQAWYESTIYARVDGYIHNWKHDIGARVKEGEVLADIDTPTLDQELKAAQAKLGSALASQEIATTERDFAKKQYDRWRTSPKGVVSDQEREDKDAIYQSSLAKLNAALAEVNNDQAEINRLKALEKFKEVTAPYDGVITAREIDIGDLVTAGSTTGTTPLFRIAQPDRIRVYVYVPQWATPDIKVGMPATAVSREYPDRDFKGTVARTSEALDPLAKTLKVEVDIPNSDWTLRPGMYLEVNFDTREARPPLRIPASALNFRSGGPQVAVIDQTGTVHFHDVSIARDMGNFVEIGSGLSQGDLVALNISNQISDGDHVSVHEAREMPAAPASKPGKPPTAVADKS